MADKAISVSKPATAGDDYVVLVQTPIGNRLFLTELPGVYSPHVHEARRWRGRDDERAATRAALASAQALSDRGWRVLVVYDFGSESEAARQVRQDGSEVFVDLEAIRVPSADEVIGRAAAERIARETGGAR